MIASMVRWVEELERATNAQVLKKQEHTANLGWCSGRDVIALELTVAPLPRKLRSLSFLCYFDVV